VTFEWSDLVTILVLVVLEGLLSGDNALVLAVLVLPLPEDQQRKALRYGILGAFALRIVATLLAVYLRKMMWVSLVGGLYLLYLPYKHFTEHPDEQPTDTRAAATATGILGLSLFWTIVVKADLLDLAFAVDSILAAVAMANKLWVIITGGLLGILMMRLLTMQVLELIKRYPKLIEGAYVVVAWVGIKLVWSFLSGVHVPPDHDNTAAAWAALIWEHLAGRTAEGRPLMPELREWVSIAVVLTLFAAGFIYARAHQKASVRLRESIAEAETLFAPEIPSDES
jgi:YkoY family integral membrane protein